MAGISRIGAALPGGLGSSSHPVVMAVRRWATGIRLQAGIRKLLSRWRGGSLPDLLRAVELNPRDYQARLVLALARAHLGQRKAALRDLAHCGQLGPDRPDHRFWIAALGPQPPTESLSGLARQKAWPAPLARLMLGQLDQAAALALARSAGGTRAQRRETQVWTVLGLMAERRGDPEVARGFYERANAFDLSPSIFEYWAFWRLRKTLASGKGVRRGDK